MAGLEPLVRIRNYICISNEKRHVYMYNVSSLILISQMCSSDKETLRPGSAESEVSSHSRASSRSGKRDRKKRGQKKKDEKKAADAVATPREIKYGLIR